MNKRILLIVSICLGLSSLLQAYTETTISNRKEAQQAIAKTLEKSGEGQFINVKAPKKSNEQFFSLGFIPDFKQYSASFRNGSCWMIPATGESEANIPTETQFLLIDRGQSNYLMMIPMVEKTTRCCLEGDEEKGIVLIGETGDRFTLVDQFLGFYMLAGYNPQEMIKQASAEIQTRLKTFELRENKSEPWFADHFGWCTWNALYTKLSEDTLMYAMDNFKDKEIPVKFMIIDAGWQAQEEGYMTSFYGDRKKFPNGLGPMIEKMKSDYSIEKVIAWQALWGTFKGLHQEKMSTWGTPVHCELPPRMQKSAPEISEDVSQVATVGKEFYPGKNGRNIIVPDFVPYMYEYSDYLRQEGVDGLKIDAMTWVESSGNGRGGRVAAMQNMMQGVQSSVSTHFNNEMINCSSCSNDYLFNAISANVTRSSGDFFPERPETHGFHVFTNAHTSFWMGEIVLPDWDMFQSGHISGDFHAAARAISGGPVYTTEEIGSEDKEVLNRLMTSYGRLPRCVDVGRICSSSLFTNPDKGDKAIKFYNRNTCNAVVGVFNCSYSPNKNIRVSENIKATDINNFEEEDYIIYQYSKNQIIPSKVNGSAVKLDALEYDIFTFAPVVNDLAIVGITNKYNAGGMVRTRQDISSSITSLSLLDGGDFLAYTTQMPSQILLDGKAIDFEYDEETKVLSAELPIGKAIDLTIIK